jgi:septum formation protein
VDENIANHANPAVSVVQTARLKADAIVARLGKPGEIESSIVVAADTTVALDEQVLGKPVDETDARRMLTVLRDRVHDVHTGLVLIDLATGKQVSDVHTARVRMRAYTDEEIRAYVATGDPMDKAGAYAIQDSTFRPVAALAGCFTGVMGLSICHLILSLRAMGVSVPADMSTVQTSHRQHPCPLYEGLSSGARLNLD